ncbi:MAG: hypothetical protein LVQ95_02930 [Candidatus Micrarchaeales archaeon]|nr:hypothetical protein [Candidatus Micrarchaeales archaeon]
MEKTTKVLLAVPIVVIATVAVLFVIVSDMTSNPSGSLSGVHIVGTTCVSSFKYLCQNTSLSTSGTLSAYVGQNTGMSEYNFALACTASANATNGGPYAAVSPWEYAGSGGALSPNYNANDTLTMQSGMKLQFNGIQCYGQNGQSFSGSAGAQFTGYVWAEFTTNAGPPSQSNPFVVVRVASIIVKIA